MRAEHALDATRVDLEQREDAAEHGIHRWQQGYDVRETMREWGHLQSVLLRELDRYATEHPQLPPDVTSQAREMLAVLCMEGNCESAARYVHLHQAAAAGRVRDLEASLSAIQALEEERAELLREAAHDLRGSVGVIANTTALLAKTDVNTALRDRFNGLLQERIRSTSALLTSLVELARLEAGQDPIQFESFDVAKTIRDYCDLLRPLAADRNLFLRCAGPDSLPIEGDSLKLHRILQNLLSNALNATTRGGIVVRWSSSSTGTEAGAWTLSVEDTGTGFGPGSKSATGPSALPSGEGLGLSIVRRLCEVLRARVELQTAPGHGTTIRVVFPLRYAGT